jgi:hypothetical protein
VKFTIAMRAGITALRDKMKQKPDGGYKLPDGTRVKYIDAIKALQKQLAWISTGMDSDALVRVVPCALCKFYAKNCKEIKLDKSCHHMCMKHGIESGDGFFCKDGIDNEIGE